jgi:spore maturation protein CgeB
MIQPEARIASFKRRPDITDNLANIIFRPVRMIMAGEFWHGATGRGLVRGFRELGWDVAEIDGPAFAGSAGGMAARVSRRLLQRSIVAAYNAEILRLAEKLDIDAFLTIKGVDIRVETIRKLRSRGISCVNFYPDVLFDTRDDRLAALVAYDKILTTKSYHAAYLDDLVGPKRHAFVAHGYCDSAHSRRHEPGSTSYRWDIGFIGNASPYKASYLIEVARAFPHCQFIIIGNGWERFAENSPLARHLYGGALTGDFFARAIEETRINIAVHHGPLGPRNWQDSTSTRSFEIPAAGGFMLHVDNSEIRSLYQVGREIDVFTDVTDLKCKIHHYLTNDKERAQVAERGHRRCVPAYSLSQRAHEIASLICRQP